MRTAVGAALLCLLLSGCGYVGPVVPPSPHIPNVVTDLKVVESGPELVVTFTTPSRTLDNLAIRRFSVLELRVGPDMPSMNVNSWAESAKEFDLPLPPENEKDVARPVNMRFAIAAADWSGQHIAVAVRTAVKNDKDYSNWSNVAHLEVLPPLISPALTVAPTPQGYRLTYTDQGAGVSYRIYRRGAPEQPGVLIGTSDKPEYTDATAQYGTSYIYSVIAAKGDAESPVSNRVSVNDKDIYPPAAPLGLTGVATGNAVELSWQRSPEPDLQGYFVYRSANSGPFERLGPITNLPAYTDTKVQHGTTYRYQITATDRTNNESDKSAPVEISFQ